MNKIFNKKKGILFWITGLSGAGKTSIAKKIKSEIIKNYGPTLEVSGDNFRKIFKFKSYSEKDRKRYLMNYLILAKFITDQKINLIYNLIGMYDMARNWNRKNIDNYIEIYLKSDVKKIIKFGKKKTYGKKSQNIVGLDIKAEFPKKPDIIINNDFTKTINELSKDLLKKIKGLNIRN
jgi:adenylylsulfate kinase-like enzyme